MPFAKGAVFFQGMGQATENFSVYKPNVKDWLTDSSFWVKLKQRRSASLAPRSTRTRRRRAWERPQQWIDGAASTTTRSICFASRSPAPTTSTRRMSFLSRTYVPILNAVWDAAPGQDVASTWARMCFCMFASEASVSPIALARAASQHRIQDRDVGARQKTTAPC